MANKNEIPINYGNLSRFYQNLKNNDLSTLNDKIDNIKVEGYQYDSSLNAISAPFDGDETLRYVLSISYNSEGFSNECEISNLYFWDDSFVWDEVGEEYGRDYDFSGLKIYHNGTPVATINTNCYSGGELAFNILESGNPFVEGEEYYIQSVHLKHPLTNKDEIALCKTTISHEGKTLLSVGRGNSSGSNIIEVTNDGNVYIEGIGNYYGNESSLSNKKSLRDIINEKVNKTEIPYSTSTTNIKRFFNLFSENSISNGASYCYSEGKGNTIGNNAYCTHVEGLNNDAGSTMYTHIEGAANHVKNISEHAEGYANVSHKASSSYGNAGNTQHSIGIDGSGFGKNAVEVMQNGDMYIYGVGGYQGTDTKVQDNTIKTLQTVISEKADSSALALKANKVDYIVPLTLDTETYEYVPDYSVLNSATTDGSYTLKYVFTQSNDDTTVAYGNLQVSQGGMLQTIHYFNGMLTYTMRMHQSNQWMTLQEFTIPCIWQSNIGKSISSYSAEKVDELIASLEARIAALEGN